MFNLSAKALYRQQVVTDLGLRNNISLFPLFDSAGTTRQVVVVSESPARIYLVNWRPGLVTKPILRPLQLNISLQALEEASEDDARAATVWWHFDPWWLLNERSLVDHSAASYLKETNAVKILEKAQSVTFTRDLSRIAMVCRLISPGQWEYNAYEPAMLPERQVASSRASSHAKTGWQLRPFWDRESQDIRGRRPASSLSRSLR